MRIGLSHTLTIMLIGADLAVTGAALQGNFRNPLVDSIMLGVTSGAGFGAALLAQIAGRDVAFVISSHNPNTALLYVHHVVLKKVGQGIVSGSPAEALTEERLLRLCNMPVKAINNG